jgi:hypothetical protein
MAAGLPAAAMDRSLNECPDACEDSSTGVAGGIDSMPSRRMLTASASCFRGASPRQDDGGDSRRQTERALLSGKG